MADVQTKTLTLTAVTGAVTLRDTHFSTAGMRDFVFSVEVSASASTASDTLIVTVWGTNTDEGNISTSNDNYWESLITFSTLLGNGTVPSIVHRDNLNILSTASSNSIRPYPKWLRFKYVTVDASASGSWTAKIRASWNTAVLS